MSAGAGLRVCRRLVAALAIIAGAAAPGRSQQTADIVVSFPPDKTLVTKGGYLPVEGYVRSRTVEDVEIVVNDERPVHVEVNHGVFADEVGLDDGLNVVRIGPVVRNVWLDDGREKPPPGYVPVYGHYGLSDACLECHEVDENGAFTLAGEREEICGWLSRAHAAAATRCTAGAQPCS